MSTISSLSGKLDGHAPAHDEQALDDEDNVSTHGTTTTASASSAGPVDLTPRGIECSEVCAFFTRLW